MKLIDSLAADYWIKNTDKIYAEDLHISTPVMEAYKAGFKTAVREAVNRIYNLGCDPAGSNGDVIQDLLTEEENES